MKINRAVSSVRTVNLVWYNVLFKLKPLTLLDCKHEAGCLRSGHLLNGESRPNVIVLILGGLHPDLPPFRHTKSWCNLSDISITDFHNVFIIIWIWVSTSPTFLILEVQLLHVWAASAAQSLKYRFLALQVWHNCK